MGQLCSHQIFDKASSYQPPQADNMRVMLKMIETTGVVAKHAGKMLFNISNMNFQV